MTIRRLVWKNITYFWRTHIPLATGAALSTAIVIGALLANDAIRFTLISVSEDRLGKTEYAYRSEERFVYMTLADKLEARLSRETTGLISLRGISTSQGGLFRGFDTRVYGVPDDFWNFARNRPPSATINGNGVAINRKLAEMLSVKTGDFIVIRVKGVSLMPGDAPLSAFTDATRVFRLPVSYILNKDELGDFGLDINQINNPNVFISYKFLADAIGLPDRINVLLVAGESGGETSKDLLDSTLRELWTPSDAGITVEALYDGTALFSDSVYIESAIRDAGKTSGAKPGITYFADRIIRKVADLERIIPYSFVAAIDLPRLPAGMRDDEIALNRWAAADLQANVGDTIVIEYRIPGPGSELVIQSSEYRVRDIIEIHPEDRNLLPKFPGISGAANCRDWDPGFSIDIGLIRDADEDYWDLHGGSPKAFITAAEGARIWANRFGSATSLHFASSAAGEIEGSIMTALVPASLGIHFQPVRELSREAAVSGVDFGELFIGLSIFVMAAAMILTFLLFHLSIRRRSSEIGMLTAVGLSDRRIVTVLILEMTVIALVSGGIGTAMGIAYNKLILRGMETIWREAVRLDRVSQHVSGNTLLIGFTAGFILTFTVLYAAIRSRLKKDPISLLHGRDNAISGIGGMRFGLITRLVCAGALFAGAVATAAAGGLRGGLQGGAPPGAPMQLVLFLVSGALLLAGLMIGYAALLLFLEHRSSVPSRRFTLSSLGIANAARRRWRSLSIALLFSCGIFIITVVGAFRQDAGDQSTHAKSGTGGYQYIVETLVPLSSRFDEIVEMDTQTAELRVLEGNDASCLNIHRVSTPRVMGVRAGDLAGRFSFSGVLAAHGRQGTWDLLNKDLGPGVVPAIADQTVITWGLGLELGDELVYLDESGERVRLQLVAGLENSVFQGNILISEQAFIKHFPQVSGYRFYLVDTVNAGADSFKTKAGRQLATFGPQITSTTTRLNEFHSVQNTYLAIFSTLGVLGLVLGSVGLSVVVMRNIAESRGEYGILMALGFSRGAIRAMVTVEHMVPLATGCLSGMIAGVISVFPRIIRAGYVQTAFPAVAIPLLFFLGVIWIYTAAGSIREKNLLAALRHE